VPRVALRERLDDALRLRGSQVTALVDVVDHQDDAGRHEPRSLGELRAHVEWLTSVGAGGQSA
jgi:hypothetical protein